MWMLVSPSLAPGKMRFFFIFFPAFNAAVTVPRLAYLKHRDNMRRRPLARERRIRRRMTLRTRASRVEEYKINAAGAILKERNKSLTKNQSG
jgi:hypothetical protein